MIAQSPQNPSSLNLVPFDPSEEATTWHDLDRPLMVLRVHLSDDRRTFFGYASAISTEGLRIAATLPRDEGDIYRLEVPLPAPLEETVQCSCEVVWKRDWAKGHSPGMALRFLDLSEDVAAELAAWIEERTNRIRYRSDAA